MDKITGKIFDSENQYIYRECPLIREAATNLAIYLYNGKTFKTSDIDKAILDTHLKNGGLPSKYSSGFWKSARIILPKDTYEQISTGHWRINFNNYLDNCEIINDSNNSKIVDNCINSEIVDNKANNKQSKVDNGYVYIMTTAVDGIIKIGKSNNWKERCNSLKETGYKNLNGLNTYLVVQVSNMSNIETIMHDIFRESRVIANNGSKTELFACNKYRAANVLKQMGKVVFENDTN